MTGKTHGAWGMVGGAGVAYLSLTTKVPDTGLILQLLGILVAGLAALIPDLDSEEALIHSLPAQEGQRTGFLPLAIVGAVLSGVVRLVSAIVRLFTKHREGTHRVWALLLGTVVAGVLTGVIATSIPMVTKHQAVTLSSLLGTVGSRPVLLAAAYIAVVFAIGWGSHLFLDSLTPEGTYPFRPFWNVHLRLLRIKTSSAGDKVLGTLGNSLVGVFIVLYCFTLLQRHGWLPWDLLPGLLPR